ncbi:diguanylate cyclase domain-containing protein [Amphibacillus indicireducens]|uniref:GGDEF domain-containing protein n=1 Tax=Amphibacillus indicireducens TaxID=1076330 RepID=A0ABP7V3B3_9BACI
MNKHFSLGLMITVISLLLHNFDMPVFFGLTVSLSLIGLMLAVRFLPFSYAVIVSAIINALIYFDGGMARFSILAFIHVVIIAWLYNREKKELFKWSFLTVLIVGIVYFLFTFFYLGYNDLRLLAYLSFLQHGILLILVALTLDLTTVYLPYFPYLRKSISYRKPILFGQVIFNVIVVVAIIPLMLVTSLKIYIKYNETIDYFVERSDDFDELVHTYIDQLDEIEVQRFLLGSTIERGYFNQSIEQFVADTNDKVYVFNDDQSIFTTSESAQDYRFLDQRMRQGNIIQLTAQDSIWIDSSPDPIRNWYNGHFINKVSFIDKEIHLIMPLVDQFIPFITEMILYYLLIMIVFFASFIFGLIADWILTKQLAQLNNLASELPLAMIKQKEIVVPKSRIIEFSQLANNIGIVGDRLKRMFLELDEKTEQLRKSEQTLYRVAHSDNLTGLPNRRSFYRDLEELIEERLNKFAILFIDFDQFKLVNDTYGHSSGDQLLIDISNRVRSFNQRYEGVYFYRLAGDEFIEVIRGASDTEVEQFGQSLLSVLAKPFSIKGEQVYISASIGISFYPAHGNTLDALLNAADQAMYELKNKGKNGLNFAPKRGDHS